MSGGKITKKHQNDNCKTEYIRPMVVPLQAELLGGAIYSSANTRAKDLVQLVAVI